MNIQKLIIPLIIIILFSFNTNQIVAQTKRQKVKKEVRKTVKKKRKRHKTRNKHVRTYKHYKAHHHYRHHPKWGLRVKTVPVGGVFLNFRGLRYKFVNGVYYKPFSGGYAVVGAPIGIRIKILPTSYSKVTIKGHPNPYYYHYGNYYTKVVNINNQVEYTTVKPPIGAQIIALPEGYTTTIIDNETYYVLDDVHYKEIITGENEDDVYYEVVSPK